MTNYLIGHISQGIKKIAIINLTLGLIAVFVGFFAALMGIGDDLFFIGLCIMGGGIVFALCFGLFFYVIGEVLECLKIISENSKVIADILSEKNEMTSSGSVNGNKKSMNYNDIPEI